jgi:fluoride exporter
MARVMNPIIPVMLGGALGAALRYFTSSLLTRTGSDFPYATLSVNLVGGFAMGVLATFVLRGAASEGVRLFVGVGILGGFTTFSAFSLESFQMIERGDWMSAGGYALASVIGSILMLGLGVAATRAVAS